MIFADHLLVTAVFLERIVLLCTNDLKNEFFSLALQETFVANSVMDEVEELDNSTFKEVSLSSVDLARISISTVALGAYMAFSLWAIADVKGRRKGLIRVLTSLKFITIVFRKFIAVFPA